MSRRFALTYLLTPDPPPTSMTWSVALQEDEGSMPMIFELEDNVEVEALLRGEGPHPLREGDTLFSTDEKNNLSIHLLASQRGAVVRLLPTRKMNYSKASLVDAKFLLALNSADHNEFVDYTDMDAARDTLQLSLEVAQATSRALEACQKAVHVCTDNGRLIGTPMNPEDGRVIIAVMEDRFDRAESDLIEALSHIELWTTFLAVEGIDPMLAANLILACGDLSRHGDLVTFLEEAGLEEPEWPGAGPDSKLHSALLEAASAMVKVVDSRWNRTFVGECASMQRDHPGFATGKIEVIIFRATLKRLAKEIWESSED
jgi:hypothetical protein